MEQRQYRRDGRRLWERLPVTLRPAGEARPEMALALSARQETAREIRKEVRE
jgi:hypothetical protein